MQENLSSSIKDRPKSSLASPEAKSTSFLWKRTNLGSSVKLYTKQNKDCILKREEIPIISMTEHAVGYCLCHLCTCGNHICPGGSLKKSITKGSYVSSYNQAFKGTSQFPLPSVDVPVIYKSHSPDPVLTTTHREEFKPIPIEKITPPSPTPAPQMTFEGRNSVYKREYPDWKVPGTVLYKEMHHAYDPSVKNKYLASTYKTNYQQPRSHASRSAPRLRCNIKADIPSFVKKSTNKIEFSNKFAIAGEMNRKDPQIKSTCAKIAEYKNQFKTVYKEQYKNNKPTYIPRKR